MAAEVPVVQEMTDRPAEDIPFLVRIDGRRFLIWAGGLAAVCWLLAGGLLGGVAYLVAREAAVGRPATMALAGLPVLLLGGLLAATVTMWHGRFTGRGPVLAADRTGVWVANGSFRANPVWLPWDAVSAVQVRRTGIEDLIFIDAQTPHPAVPPGARLMVPTMLLDCGSTQIVAALGALAAGRAPVYGRW
ncbi:hypothetical protein O7621_00645 [Solwaraspora sp. WMMD937]|uniref:hypothetical protein n=1 Tax=Solwaraspora sp. WMMD937 TaxID=3016090 RepID=UPI00249C210B|nr:hypothetical protein [Solwaraspora sp. WMMD937]WFE21933.1 hypothetical protein O7621_00645 [Solwaraspora sp. WMMD937]